MTEAEWLACTDPIVILEFLRGKTSARKLRLFAVSGFRRLLRLSRLVQDVGDDSWDRMIDIAERHADGLATPSELPSWGHPDGIEREGTMAPCMHQLLLLTAADSYPAAQQTIGLLAGWKLEFTGQVSYTRPEELPILAELLRDLIGDPFLPRTLEPSWLSCNDRAVLHLAQGIYAERAFERMPILGDALEEAGCADADVLRHCRQPDGHVRGCWVVDLLLAKE
jgi:hypothetical protein